ncbi:hypothetical protein PGTUg99_030326 [Puccinia graminis f. sp. tritici]|uniref:Uncharacterized protein n=1 Tax=Puccinia graminis f. sp. tritici TaxID=56615 RepID=A0A5B0P4K8_PUCGR|nr:hypothetical protein PGTUg99_030326 [Puccinia graminis f. sp. tritici]
MFLTDLCIESFAFNVGRRMPAYERTTSCCTAFRRLNLGRTTLHEYLPSKERRGCPTFSPKVINR